MASLRSSLFIVLIVVLMASALASSAAPSANSTSGGKSTNDSSSAAPSGTGTDDASAPALSPDDVVEGGLGSPLPAGAKSSDTDQSAGSPADGPSSKNAASDVKVQVSAVVGIVLSASLLL